MLRSFLLVALASLFSLSLPSPSLAQRAPPTPPNNGTLNMRFIQNGPFSTRQEAGSALWTNPTPFTFTSTSGQQMTWQSGFVVSYGGERLNDVWITSDNGANWQLVSGRMGNISSAVPVNGLDDQSRTADCNDGSNLYLVGGSRGSAHTSNVSHSSDILHWTQYGRQAFYPRQRSTCAVNKAGEVYVMGGITVLPRSTPWANSSNDVWYSASRGQNWQMISYASDGYTLGAQWQERSGHDSEFVTATSNGQEVLYVMGGFIGSDHFNDIWISTNNARSFVRLNPAAEWWERMDFQLSVAPNGVMIVSGGEYRSTYNLNDVWASLDGGYSWGQCCRGATCGYEVREDHVTEVTKSGHLLLWSGSKQNSLSNGNANDVWLSDISFLDTAAVAQRCGLKQPPGGVGLRCIPGGYCPQHPFHGTGGRGFQMQRMADADWIPRFEGGIALWNKPLTFRQADGSGSKTINSPLVMYGGRGNYGSGSTSIFNDVWAFDTVAMKWYLIGGTTPNGQPSMNTNNPLQDQGRTADCSDNTGRMYTIAGTLNGVSNSRVYMSVDGGLNWIMQTDNAPFPAREAAACATGSDGKVWMMGGSLQGGGNANDVWQSTDNGKRWTPRTGPNGAPWSKRTQADADVLQNSNLDGKDIIYFGNGYDGVKWPGNRQNDIWVSSNGGSSWAAVTTSPPFRGRQDGQLIVTGTGALILVAGDMGLNYPGNSNDIWASLDGGYNWGVCNLTAGFSPREDHVAILDKSNYLWVIQGEAPDDPLTGNSVPRNDVWRSTQQFTDNNIATLCSLKKPACGTGLRCWPGSKSCVNNCPPQVDPVDPDEPVAPSDSGSGGGLSATYIALIAIVVAAVAGVAFFLYYKRFIAPNASQQNKDSELLGVPLTTGGTDSNGAYHHLDVGHGQTNGQL